MPIEPHTRVGITALALLGALSFTTGSARAQTLAEHTATPEGAASLFLRSVRAIRWEGAAAALDAPTLARFHQTVGFMVEADTTGRVTSFLLDTDPAGFSALSHQEVFRRSIGAMIDDMPGLMHALFDRDDEILGHVAEGAATAHVVYRTTARLSGAVPEVKVLQLARGGAGWRVVWSDELEVLDAALRGVARTRTPPPPRGSP